MNTLTRFLLLVALVCVPGAGAVAVGVLLLRAARVRFVEVPGNIPLTDVYGNVVYPKKEWLRHYRRENPGYFYLSVPRRLPPVVKKSLTGKPRKP